MSIPRALYRDGDWHDRANDAHVSALFGDDYEYGIPPVHRPRVYRPSLSSAIGHAARVAADPSPHISSSRERLGPLSSTKESNA